MNEQNIRDVAYQAIIKSKNDQESEDVKLDFKREWYNLSTKADQNKFLKDVTAIVNTPGDYGFIIIGWDEKGKKFYDSKFSDSGLKDSNEIQGLIARYCSDIFDLVVYDITIDEHYLSVIAIPPFYEVPVLMKNYQTFNRAGNIQKEINHCIWTRKGTTTQHATKRDINLMYYNRKNYQKRAGAEFVCTGALRMNTQTVCVQLVLHNYGPIPLAISGIDLVLKNETEIVVGAIDTAIVDNYTFKYMHTKSIIIEVDQTMEIGGVFKDEMEALPKPLLDIFIERSREYEVVLYSSSGHAVKKSITINKVRDGDGKILLAPPTRWSDPGIVLF